MRLSLPSGRICALPQASRKIALAAVLQHKEQCLRKAEFFFFCEKNEVETGPWKKEIGG
jgi:hypothetical protein